MRFTLRIAATLFAALALVPAGGHLFSLTSKMRLDAATYLTSQRTYDGWNLFAIVVVGALASALALAVALYRAGESWLFAGMPSETFCRTGKEEFSRSQLSNIDLARIFLGRSSYRLPGRTPAALRSRPICWPTPERNIGVLQTKIDRAERPN